MGLFDEVIGKVSEALGGKAGESSSLLPHVLEMLGGKDAAGGGGLAALLQAFQSKGLGDIASSWVSTGSNLPISPAQIQQVLGNTGLDQLAAKAGLSPEVVSAKLAEILPHAVDALTPEGKLPEGGALEQVFGLFKGRLGSS